MICESVSLRDDDNDKGRFWALAHNVNLSCSPVFSSSYQCSGSQPSSHVIYKNKDISTVVVLVEKGNVRRNKSCGDISSALKLSPSGSLRDSIKDAGKFFKIPKSSTTPVFLRVQGSALCYIAPTAWEQLVIAFPPVMGCPSDPCVRTLKAIVLGLSYVIVMRSWMLKAYIVWAVVSRAWRKFPHTCIGKQLVVTENFTLEATNIAL